MCCSAVTGLRFDSLCSRSSDDDEDDDDEDDDDDEEELTGI